MEFRVQSFRVLCLMLSTIIAVIRPQFEPALKCNCMDYWECAVGDGQISSYCGISGTEVCCFLKHESDNDTRSINFKQISTKNLRLKTSSRHLRKPVGSGNTPNATLSDRKPSRSRHTRKRTGIDSCGISEVAGLLDSRAEFSEWPWHVAILEASTDLYLCGGALIGRDKIITASHCVIAYNRIQANGVSKLKVRGGEHDVSGNFEQEPHIEIPVQEIILHPDFNSIALENDIAILRVKYPFNFTRHIRPLCLPPQRVQRRRNRHPQNYMDSSWTCVVTGWGRPSQASPMTHSIILKEVPVAFLPHARCERRLQKNFANYNYSLPMSTICAVDTISDLKLTHSTQICDGDGGGPLACRRSNSTSIWTHEGVVSFGVGCGLGVYTRVESFMGWINSAIDI